MAHSRPFRNSSKLLDGIVHVLYHQQVVVSNSRLFYHLSWSLTIWFIAFIEEPKSNSISFPVSSQIPFTRLSHSLSLILSLAFLPFMEPRRTWERRQHYQEINTKTMQPIQSSIKDDNGRRKWPYNERTELKEEQGQYNKDKIRPRARRQATRGRGSGVGFWYFGR